MKLAIVAGLLLVSTAAMADDDVMHMCFMPSPPVCSMFKQGFNGLMEQTVCAPQIAQYRKQVEAAKHCLDQSMAEVQQSFDHRTSTMRQ